MYIFVYEDGVAKISKTVTDDDKRAFDCGYVLNIFNVTDVENIQQWNGVNFEEVDEAIYENGADE